MEEIVIDENENKLIDLEIGDEFILDKSVSALVTPMSNTLENERQWIIEVESGYSVIAFDLGNGFWVLMDKMVLKNGISND